MERTTDNIPSSKLVLGRAALINNKVSNLYKKKDDAEIKPRNEVLNIGEGNERGEVNYASPENQLNHLNEQLQDNQDNIGIFINGKENTYEKNEENKSIEHGSTAAVGLPALKEASTKGYELCKFYKSDVSPFTHNVGTRYLMLPDSFWIDSEGQRKSVKYPALGGREVGDQETIIRLAQVPVLAKRQFQMDWDMIKNTPTVTCISKANPTLVFIFGGQSPYFVQHQQVFEFAKGAAKFEILINNSTKEYQVRFFDSGYNAGNIVRPLADINRDYKDVEKEEYRFPMDGSEVVIGSGVDATIKFRALKDSNKRLVIGGKHCTFKMLNGKLALTVESDMRVGVWLKTREEKDSNKNSKPYPLADGTVFGRLECEIEVRAADSQRS